jgi:hypothetical protein
MTFTEIFSEAIPLVLTALGSIAGTWGTIWKVNDNRKKQKQNSTQLLYEELETLKTKLIEKTMKEIEAADQSADIQIILHRMEAHCKECFDAVMAKVKQSNTI